MRNSHAPNLLSLAFICLIVANYLGTFADLDFTWQIRTGARIGGEQDESEGCGQGLMHEHSL